MTGYAVFLRGVNVGGITIRMAEMRGAIATLPVRDVRTILASGNILVDSDIPIEELKPTIESTLRVSFGYDAWVIVLARDRVAALVATCPYPADDPATHAYITLASDPSALDDLMSAAAPLPDADHLRLGPEAVAWTAPVGGTLESPFARLTSASRYRTTTTTRNLRTLIKVGSEGRGASKGGP